MNMGGSKHLKLWIVFFQLENLQTMRQNDFDPGKAFLASGSQYHAPRMQLVRVQGLLSGAWLPRPAQIHPFVGITRGPWSKNHQSNRLLGILKTHLKTYERLITYKIYKISPVPCLVYITYPRVNSETAQHGKAMSQGPGGPLMMICRANPEPVLPEILGAREWLK